MRQLKDNERKIFKDLAHSEKGEFLREWLSEVVRELSSVNTVKSDPIESRRVALDILEVNLVSHLRVQEQSEQQEVETYE